MDNGQWTTTILKVKEVSNILLTDILKQMNKIVDRLVSVLQIISLLFHFFQFH
jgi:hypothetical protein